jgi:hypothetical protein
MVNLVGRDPDERDVHGSRFYKWVYIPTDDSECENLKRHARTLASWLDDFDILFSGSRVEFGEAPPRVTKESPLIRVPYNKPVLRVEITPTPDR